MNERSRRVVLLIDYDNLQICASRDTPGRDLQLGPVVQLAQRYGTVVVARAYAEWTLSPDVVVLATSDKDLIPLVRVAKQRGAFVVVLGSDYTAIPLREMADEHVTYRQLITDATGRPGTEAGPGRQPAALPEPSRR